MDLQNKIKQYILENGLPGHDSRLLVGLSGGADSVCLALVLQELGYSIHCIHCNFHLRGKESSRDEQFVREFCTRHDMSLEVVGFDTIGYSRSHGISIEMAARDLRYDYFRKRKSSLGLDYICVAHHKEDSIETFFINLLRGSGLRGLCGIRELSSDVFRPLLCCSRDEILSYLSSRGESHVEDSSNVETAYLRNKIRLQILPMLESIRPGAGKNILKTTENLRESYKVYSTSIEEEIRKIREIGKAGLEIYSKKSLLESASPLSLLHELIGGKGFNRVQQEQILRSISTVGKIFESSDYRLMIERDTLVLVPLSETSYPPLYEELKIGRGEYCIKDESRRVGIRYHIEEYSSAKIVRDVRFCYIDTGKLQGPMILRGTRVGDRFCPFGMKGRKLVSDYLTDEKLSIGEKSRQLVVENNGRIAWLVGLRGSEEFRCGDMTQYMLVMEVFEW